MIGTAARQNQQNDLCAKRRLRAAWAFAQSVQSLFCALNWKAMALLRSMERFSALVLHVAFHTDNNSGEVGHWGA